MDKFLKKWIRKIHRWLVIPFIALLLTVLFARGTTIGNVAQRIQAVFLIVMAITGAYLFLLPLWARWKRGKSIKTK